MKTLLLLAGLLILLLAAWRGPLTCARGDAAVVPSPTADADQRDQVATVERAFARSMADRDLAAFAAHVAEDAVFLNGGQPLRGKPAIVAHWARFFEGSAAPFSWEPDLVEVNGRGDLAQSIGPVREPGGTVVARFYSTWRRERDGTWRIVFDNGYDVPAAPAAD